MLALQETHKAMLDTNLPNISITDHEPNRLEDDTSADLSQGFAKTFLPTRVETNAKISGNRLVTIRRAVTTAHKKRFRSH